MAKKSLLTSADLHDLLSYDAQTGKLFWRPRLSKHFEGSPLLLEARCKTWNSRFSGKQALNSDNGIGYKCGFIFHKKYYAHRVIWCMAQGQWPDSDIDHVDQDKSNNRIENLRPATKSENGANVSFSRGSSAYKGVSWKSSAGKWVSYIGESGKRVHLGYFSDESEAARAYNKAAFEKFGDFASLNEIEFQ